MSQNLKRVGSLSVEDNVLTAYTLDVAKNNELGGIKLFDDSERAVISVDCDYAVQLSGEKAYVHVPVSEYEFTEGLKCENNSVSVVLSDLVVQNDYVKVVNNKLSVDDNTKVTYVIWSNN